MIARMLRPLTTALLAAALCLPASAAMQGPLRVHPQNPRYFTDDSGRAILLAGSHTWQNLQDSGSTYPPPVFDYTKFLDFLSTHGHNFFRLWGWEQSNWTNEIAGNWWFAPLVYLRSGPGNAIDGRPKMNVSSFDPAYFNRMRQRVLEARDRGLYVAIVLFNGWSVEAAKGSHDDGNPWRGHPYNPLNNVNGINGDPNGDDSGKEAHTLAVAAVTDAQLAYIRKTIDTVNDLDNVLWEISNESHSEATDWQYYLIEYIRSYEAGKPKQHPIGMSVEWPAGTNAELFASAADWISPNKVGSDYLNNPPAADGRKVIVSDSDHLCGICGTRAWVWKSVTRGIHTAFMDVYDGKATGLGAAGSNPNDPKWISIRANLGYARAYGDRMKLASMTPLNAIASTGYCLANPAPLGGEYLVYLPTAGTVTVDLSAAVDDVDVEWLNPETGAKYVGEPVAGGAPRTLVAPFPATDAVLYLRGQVDPTAPPNEVQGVVASKTPRVRIDWRVVLNAARYDVATGSLNNLRADKSFTRAACLANDVVDTWWEDTRGNPPRGDAHYYLVRAQGATGSGTWGQTSAGVERTPASACP